MQLEKLLPKLDYERTLKSVTEALEVQLNYQENAFIFWVGFLDCWFIENCA